MCVSGQEVVIGSLLESSRILSRVRVGHVEWGVCVHCWIMRARDVVRIPR